MNVYPINAADVAGLREVPVSADAQLVIDASGDMRVGLGLSGDAPVQVSADADLRLGKRLVAESEIVVDAAADLRVGLGLIGASEVAVDADADLRLGKRVSGQSGVELDAQATLYRGLREPGETRLTLSAGLEIITAGTVPLKGASRFHLHVRGTPTVWHYVYGGGEAAITLDAIDRGRGTPTITLDGEPAPEARTFIVPPDPRAWRLSSAERSF